MYCINSGLYLCIWKGRLRFTGVLVIDIFQNLNNKYSVIIKDIKIDIIDDFFVNNHFLNHLTIARIIV